VTIVVVAAVITDGDRFFITRRQRGVHLEGLWEFPGGKVDPHEAHVDALRREIREELDADVEVRHLLLETTHTYPDRSVRLFFYDCGLIGTPRPMLGQEMRWVSREELPTLGFPPADDELIKVLVRLKPDTTY